MNDARRLEPMSRHEALDMLSRVSVGRVVFTANALPAIRAVNHLVDDGGVIIRTQLNSAIMPVVGAESGVVVAYEADEIEPAAHVGWSVVVTGMAYTVRDEAETSRYEQLLRPWMDHAEDQVIRIVPDLVTGFRLVGNGVGT